MNLNDLIKKNVLSYGADLCAVADLSTAREALWQAYGHRFDGLSRAVSYAVYLPRRVVDEVLEHPTHTYLAYYDVANSLINEIGLRLSNDFTKMGFDSYPIPASQRTGAKDGSIFSHRMAAQLAGLGWIGKSCALVTKEAGPRLRLGTVLTDAALDCGAPAENLCGDCTLCTKICPAGAILGRDFDEKEELSLRFDFQKCDDYLTETRQTFGKRICGRCVAVCRFGRGERDDEVIL